MMNHINEAGQLFFAPNTSSRRTGVRMSLVASAVALCLISVVVPSNAASINYGDFNGTTVMFLDVTESSDKPLPLYGSPTIAGNSLFFSPQQFAAESSNQVPPSDLTDGQLTFMVMATQGAISEISFAESGAFLVGGFLASNTDDTYVEVTATGSMTVLAIDGDDSIVPFVIPINLDMVFDPVNGAPIVTNVWRFTSEGRTSGAWNGSLVVDISQELTDGGRSLVLGATKLAINLDNILFAQSEPLGRARIDKKLFLEISTTIPEPTTFVLVGIGIFGLVAGRSRSRRLA